MSNMNFQQLMDKFAISVSTLCALHCAITPIIVIMVPVLSSTFVMDEAFHQLLVALIIPSSLVALFIGCRKHQDQHVKVIGIIGLISLTLVALVGHDLLGETGEKIATVFSSLILIWAHIRNYRLCRETKCQEC